MPTDLLPPNSTPMERALSLATARLGQVPAPLRALWDPEACPADLLPWLAWALSIDRWRVEWTEAQKRFEIARAIDLQRKKGTPASVEQVIASFDPLIRMLEWFEQEPAGAPHTFQVTIPLGYDPEGGEPLPRSTAAFALELVRDIYRVKPARAHFELWLELAIDAALFVQGAAKATVYCRFEMLLDLSGVDEALLTEDGSALLTEDDEVIEIG